MLALSLGAGVPAAQAVDTQMTIDTTSIDFGEINVGNTSAASVTLTNSGGDNFGPINMFGGAPPTPEFDATQSCQGETVVPGGFCTVVFTFAPQSPGSFADISSFTISETPNPADGEDFAVTLAGVGVELIGLSTEGAQWFENEDPSSPLDDYERFGAALAAGDFNNDGADDLATGVPLDLVDGGSVVVRYGRPGNGLVEGPVTTILRQDPETGSHLELFGGALAAGDFNGDSFDDLAVGIPDNEPGNRGAVRVYYGASGGLQTDGYEFLEELSAGEPEHASDLAYFGSALAAGNFDGDPYQDLAIGAPSGCERVAGSCIHGGSLFVAHGTADGLLPFVGYRISQNSFGIYDDVESGDKFAAALAAGDFNGDGYGDLAIGVPGEDGNSGAIEVIMGSQWGLIFANSVFWLPGALGEVPETHDRLGSCLASGDFDGDGFADLAIGAPDEDLGLGNVYVNTGAINVAYGAADPAWFDLSRTDHLAQSTLYGENQEQSDDRFGAAFGVGDFDGDGRDDLAVGHPGDDWGGMDLGAVTILMGALPTIGQSTRYQLLQIGWEGVPGDASEPDQAGGFALAVGDFDGSGRPDLAIGAPLHDNGEAFDAGGEAVLYGPTTAFADGFESGSTSRWSTVSP